MLKHLISISALVVVASGACFDNGDKEIGGACYKFVAQKLSFADARNWCHYQNPVTASYLASVSNQFTANFLASYARSAFGQNDGYFWIGLSRNKTYTPWTWDTGYQMQWSNFDSDQLSYNYAAENIVNSKWRTFAAEEQMNFVCSYDPTSPPTFAPPTSDGPSTPTPTPTAPQTTTQTVPTTTGTYPCNSQPNVAVVFELTGSELDLQIQNFIANDLLFYPGSPYQLGGQKDGKTALSLVPYPNDGTAGPLTPLMDYGFAKTQPEIRSSFDLFDNFARGPASIVDAFNLVPDLQRTGAPGFVILVANSADSVNNAVASAATLKNLGFQIVTIAFKSTGFFDNLASQASYNFKIQEDADRKTVASQIGNIIDDRSCLSSSTTTPQPTSSGCTGRWVYNGDLSIAFEFIEGSNGSQKVVDFVANTLLKNANSYGLTNDVNGNQPSKLELLPYPQTDQYPIFGYGSIKSSEDIANFISAYQGIQFQDTDPSIADAFDYLSEHPGRSKVQVVLLVASDGSDVQNTVATANNLKNSGYLVITVAQTSPANDFTPLASGDKYSLQIGNGNDDDVAAQIASLLLDWSFVCFDDGSSTAAPATTNLSTSPFPSTTPIPPCDSPYSGKIATVFELNTEQPEIQSVVNFVRDNLYNSNNYNFGTITNAINVPYANTDNYADNILAYGDAKSLADLQTNIDNLNTNAVVTVNPTISDGLQWLYANRSPGTTKAVIVIVGNHQDDDTGSTTNWLRSLKQQGYQVISVGVGSAHADFSSLADKPEWYFQVGDTNGQYVADQISSILCHL